MLDLKNIKLGTLQVDKLYIGTDLVFEKPPIDTTPPITSIRPYDAVNNPTNTYTEPQTIYFDVNEMCDTYYTLDGGTPTTASAHYLGGGILIDTTTTVKYFSVDQSGNAETPKELTYTINAVQEPPAGEIPAYPRYVRFQGFGDNASASTTRLVEFQAFWGATNLLLNKLPISGEPVDFGGTVDIATNGDFTTMTGYPIWWSGEGIPTLTYDLLDWYDISEFKVWGYSTAGDPRANKFKLFVSADNVSWFLVVDHSTNTTTQPAGGWSFTGI